MRWLKIIGKYSGTKNNAGEITFNKKIGKEMKLYVGEWSISNRKKPMTVSGNTAQAEGLGEVFKNLGKRGLNVSMTLAKNVLSNLTRALVIPANIATAAASRNIKKVISSLPQMISFYQTGTGLYLPRFIKIMLFKGTKKQIDYT